MKQNLSDKLTGKIKITFIFIKDDNKLLFPLSCKLKMLLKLVEMAAN